MSEIGLSERLDPIPRRSRQPVLVDPTTLIIHITALVKLNLEQCCGLCMSVMFAIIICSNGWTSEGCWWFYLSKFLTVQ